MRSSLNDLTKIKISDCLIKLSYADHFEAKHKVLFDHAVFMILSRFEQQIDLFNQNLHSLTKTMTSKHADQTKTTSQPKLGDIQYLEKFLALAYIIKKKDPLSDYLPMLLLDVVHTCKQVSTVFLRNRENFNPRMLFLIGKLMKISLTIIKSHYHNPVFSDQLQHLQGLLTNITCDHLPSTNQSSAHPQYRISEIVLADIVSLLENYQLFFNYAQSDSWIKKQTSFLNIKDQLQEVLQLIGCLLKHITTENRHKTNMLLYLTDHTPLYTTNCQIKKKLVFLKHGGHYQADYQQQLKQKKDAFFAGVLFYLDESIAQPVTHLIQQIFQVISLSSPPEWENRLQLFHRMLQLLKQNDLNSTDKIYAFYKKFYIDLQQLTPNHQLCRMVLSIMITTMVDDLQQRSYCFRPWGFFSNQRLPTIHRSFVKALKRPLPIKKKLQTFCSFVEHPDHDDLSNHLPWFDECYHLSQEVM